MELLIQKAETYLDFIKEAIVIRLESHRSNLNDIEESFYRKIDDNKNKIIEYIIKFFKFMAITHFSILYHIA